MSMDVLEKLKTRENFKMWHLQDERSKDPDRKGRYPLPGTGPWVDEPDKIQWVDNATGLDCLMLRNHMGNWCGYVGVPKDHPLYDKDYDQCCQPEDCEDWSDCYDKGHLTPNRAVEVHGGLTFADFCSPGEPVDGICHVAAEGREEKVWWLGFDCGHGMDLSPGMLAWEVEHGFTDPRVLVTGEEGVEKKPWGYRRYRDVDYVVMEVENLAAQLAAVK